jgi:hypothetical protein
MAQYMYLIYGDPAAEEKMTQEDWQRMLKLHKEFAEKVVAGGGTVVEGNALAPSSTATTVRGQDTATTTVTDGPFAETKETLGGYYVIEAADLDAAIGFARILPTRSGGVEIRPIVDTSGS